jgi:hypothetical protein
MCLQNAASKKSAIICMANHVEIFNYIYVRSYPVYPFPQTCRHPLPVPEPMFQWPNKKLMDNSEVRSMQFVLAQDTGVSKRSFKQYRSI